MGCNLKNVLAVAVIRIINNDSGFQSFKFFSGSFLIRDWAQSMAGSICRLYIKYNVCLSWWFLIFHHMETFVGYNMFEVLPLLVCYLDISIDQILFICFVWWSWFIWGDVLGRKFIDQRKRDVFRFNVMCIIGVPLLIFYFYYYFFKGNSLCILVMIMWWLRVDDF